MKRYLGLVMLLVGVISITACSEVKDTAPMVSNMSQQDIEKYESIIQKYGQKIEEFQPRDFTKEELEKLSEGKDVADPKTPNIDWFVEKSNAEKILGRNKEAIKTLEESLKYFENSTVSWNNLGAIYAEAGDCVNANKYYSKIAQYIGSQKGSNYLMEVAKCYYRQDKRDKVIETIDSFKEMGGTDIDPEVKDYLDKN